MVDPRSRRSRRRRGKRHRNTTFQCDKCSQTGLTPREQFQCRNCTVRFCSQCDPGISRSGVYDRICQACAPNLVNCKSPMCNLKYLPKFIQHVHYGYCCGCKAFHCDCKGEFSECNTCDHKFCLDSWNFAECFVAQAAISTDDSYGK